MRPSGRPAPILYRMYRKGLCSSGQVARLVQRRQLSRLVKSSWAMPVPSGWHPSAAVGTRQGMVSSQWAVGSSQWSVVRCRDSPAWTAGQPGGEGSAIGEIGFRGHALRRPSFSKPRCLKAKMPGQHDFGRTPLLNSLYRIRSTLNRRSSPHQTIPASPDAPVFSRRFCPPWLIRPSPPIPVTARSSFQQKNDLAFSKRSWIRQRIEF